MIEEVYETKEGIYRYELGEYLHTSMRKYCDSPITSLAYCLIKMPNFGEAWGFYLNLIWKSFDSDFKPSVLQEAAMKIPPASAENSALRSCFKLFNPLDWEMMAVMLQDAMTEAKRL